VEKPVALRCKGKLGGKRGVEEKEKGTWLACHLRKEGFD